MSTGTGGEYWDTPALPSRFKHKLLSYYIPQFGGKTGSVSRRVVYLDGYAGEGRYESGDEGSAEIAMRVAADQLPRLRWHCFLVERDAESIARLERVADSYRSRGVDARVRRGDVEELLDEVVVAARELPLFLFLDPCGLGLPFERVVRLCTQQRPRQWPPTELLMNFSLMAVWRLGGNVRSKKGLEASMERVDAVCGGRWWREYYERDEANAHDQVALEYARRLHDASGVTVCSVPVAKQPHHKPIYHLVFATRSQHGLWVFSDAVARARDYWWESLEIQQTEEDQDALFTTASILRPDPAEISQAAIPQIVTNLDQLLRRRGAFRIVDHTLDVLGTFYGQVTEPVVRKAVKDLHQRGGTACTGKGSKVHELRVTPPGPAGPHRPGTATAPGR